MKLVRNKKKALLSMAVAQASLALAIEASAESFVVTNGANSGTGSLRAAIAAAALSGDDGDIITIDAASISEISLDASLVIPGEQALIISAPVADDGSPQVSITASGNGFPLLRIDGAGGNPVVLSGLEFTGANNFDNGGAISAEDALLVLDKSVVTGNTARGAGGGIAVAEVPRVSGDIAVGICGRRPVGGYGERRVT